MCNMPYVDSNLAPIRLWRAVNTGRNGLYARGNIWQQGYGIQIDTARRESLLYDTQGQQAYSVLSSPLRPSRNRPDHG